MRTLLLDRTTWDWVIDRDGNIAVAHDPYSQAQDAASEIKTFQGEGYYDTRAGIPYFQEILGKAPPISYVKAKMSEAALTTPGTKAAKVYISAAKDRVLRGQVQVTNDKGQKSAANF